MASYEGGYGGGGGYAGAPTNLGGYGAPPTMMGGDYMPQDLSGGLPAHFMKGPQGIQMLAFGGGCAAVTIGVLGLLRITEEGFVEWIIAFYQLAFGLIMITLEIQGEWVEKYPRAKDFQAALVEYARFLTILGGRGLFYFFVGSLCIGNGVSPPFELDETLVGLYIFFIGAICIAMQFQGQVGGGQAGPAYGDPRGY
jgi:hypothetical protein